MAGEAVGEAPAAEPRLAYLRRVVAAWEQKYMAEHDGEKPCKLTYCPQMLKLRQEYLVLKGKRETMS